jgi:hypothetical protein
VREKVAARLRADLDAAAKLLADAAVAIKASAKADLLSANRGCDSKCIEKTVVKHSTDFCRSIDKVVKKLGEGKYCLALGRVSLVS